MAEVVFSSDLAGVDWVELKAALAADHFDNGRTPEQYRQSHENSHAVIFGRCAGRFVANGRVLSDGVCNAYLVDIWTASDHRSQGIGRQVVTQLLATVPGQHVALFTSDAPAFYAALGFQPEHGGMSQIIGTWLNRH